MWRELIEKLSICGFVDCNYFIIVRKLGSSCENYSSKNPLQIPFSLN